MSCSIALHLVPRLSRDYEQIIVQQPLRCKQGVMWQKRSRARPRGKGSFSAIRNWSGKVVNQTNVVGIFSKSRPSRLRLGYSDRIQNQHIYNRNMCFGPFEAYSLCACWMVLRYSLASFFSGDFSEETVRKPLLVDGPTSWLQLEQQDIRHQAYTLENSWRNIDKFRLEVRLQKFWSLFPMCPLVYGKCFWESAKLLLCGLRFACVSPCSQLKAAHNIAMRMNLNLMTLRSPIWAKKCYLMLCLPKISVISKEPSSFGALLRCKDLLNLRTS